MNTAQLLLLPLAFVACVAVDSSTDIAAEIDHANPTPRVFDESTLDLHEREALATMLEGRYALAHKMFMSIAQEGLPSELLPAAGRCAMLAGELDQAREWLEHYLLDSSNDVMARLDLARAQLLAGDPLACLRQCQGFSERASRNVAVVELRVIANMALDNPRGARRSLEYAESIGVTRAILTPFYALIRGEELKP